MAVVKSVKTLSRARALLAALFLPAAAMGAAENGAVPPAKPLAEVLSVRDRRRMEDAVDRALGWIASQQAANGSFPTLPQAQPAITSLCVLAFLSRGHQPGLGPYGAAMEKGIDFVISCQRPDGLFSYQLPEAAHVDDGASHAAVYNHAIAGLMLGEVYGHVTGRRAGEVKQAMEKALQFTRDLQTRPKEYAGDKGGWRYLRLRYFPPTWDMASADSDLSVTAWQLMFLRSARNAEFSVPQKYIDEAMEFVHRCWKEKEGVFYYAIDGPGPGDIRSGRGMVAAGIVSLALAGQHQTPMELAAGDWLLGHPYRGFGDRVGIADRFFYSAYYSSQAAAQLGGRYWEGIFPPLSAAVLSGQSSDGSWPAEVGHRDMMFGNVYTSALAVLTLTPAFQLLPVYQR